MHELSVADFRRHVRAGWPYVTVSIRTVGFVDLARASRKVLRVSGDRPGDLQHINTLAAKAGILPDSRIALALPKAGLKSMSKGELQ